MAAFQGAWDSNTVTGDTAPSFERVESDGRAVAEGDVFNFGAAHGSDDGIAISRTAAFTIAAALVAAAYLMTR